MRFDPAAPPAELLAFLAERHLATLSTPRPGRPPHVVPVGFTYDRDRRWARVITSGDSVKVRHAGRPDVGAALCSVDGARWVTLSGPVRVETDPEAVREAENRYSVRYRRPRVNPKRVVLIMEVEELLGSTRFAGSQD